MAIENKSPNTGMIELKPLPRHPSAIVADEMRRTIEGVLTRIGQHTTGLARQSEKQLHEETAEVYLGRSDKGHLCVCDANTASLVLRFYSSCESGNYTPARVRVEIADKSLLDALGEEYCASITLFDQHCYLQPKDQIGLYERTGIVEIQEYDHRAKFKAALKEIQANRERLANLN